MGVFRFVDCLLCSETGTYIFAMLHFLLSLFRFYKATFQRAPTWVYAVDVSKTVLSSVRVHLFMFLIASSVKMELAVGFIVALSVAVVTLTYTNVQCKP